MGGAGSIQLPAGAEGAPFSLIRQTVAVVDEDGPPPADLRLAWECSRYPGSLPNAGGINDQEWRTMYRMRVLLNIYNAMARLRSARGKEIHRLTSNEREILGWLQKQGLLYG